MKLVYPVIFTPYEESHGYVAEIPDLPGCVTGGNSMVNAIEMAVDAASGWILDEIEDGNEIPKASDIKDIRLENDNSVISLIVLDMDDYAEKYGKKAVRKNLTIPAWLATAADKVNVNYSQTLQNALIEQLHLA